MRLKKVIFSVMFILIVSTATLCQVQDWRKLVALESNRDKVEKILGKPEIFFDTFGTYQTEIGKFYVWYSKGGCHKNVEGLQYNTPAQKLTKLLFYPKNSLPLESYISNKEDFQKQEPPVADSRPGNHYLYTSPDEIIIYQTIVRNDSTEFVYTIELQPSREKQNLLCKGDKNKK